MSTAVVAKEKKEKKAKTTLPFPISTQYVRDWTGAWPPIRELIQNGEDAKRKGYPLEIKYTKNVEGEGVLHIINQGITMDRDTLVLGNSSKIHDPEMAGKFGEGMKLAWMILLREHRTVWTKVGSERWIPKLAYSADFKSEIMFIDIAPCKFENLIHVKIEGISERDWESIQSKVLSLSPPKSKMSNSRGSILLDPEHQKKLYVKGLYVGELTDAEFGYDLLDLSLDRDRRVPSKYDIEYEISSLWQELLAEDKIDIKSIIVVLGENNLEGRSLHTYSGSNLASKIFKYFEEIHESENIILVSSTTEEEAAKHYGLVPVHVSFHVKEFYEKYQTNFSTRLKALNKKVSNTYSISDLRDDEREVFQEIIGKLKNVIPENMIISIVDFKGDTIRGLFTPSSPIRIDIARKLLTSRFDTLKVLVHEISHIEGKDASFSHSERMCDILTQLVIS